jgi:hypothetical protein
MTAFTEVQFKDAFAHASAEVMPLSLQIGTAVGARVVGTEIWMTNRCSHRTLAAGMPDVVGFVHLLDRRTRILAATHLSGVTRGINGQL